MTHEEETKLINDLHNKFILLGGQSVLVSPYDFRWSGWHADSRILISRLNTDAFIYLPSEISRGYDSMSLNSLARISKILISSIDNLKICGKCPRNATSLFSLFEVNTLDLSELDVSETTMLGATFCRTRAHSLLLPNFGKVKDVTRMFADSLIEKVNKFEIDTSGIKDFTQMFDSTYITQSLADIELDTTSADTYSEMYHGATIHAKLNLSKFKYKGVTLGSMFSNVTLTRSSEIILKVEHFMKLNAFTRDSFARADMSREKGLVFITLWKN